MRRSPANLFRGFEGSFVRERRNYLLLMGAIAAALVGAVMLAVPGSPAYKKPTLGLDLRGGIEVVLRAVPNKGQQVDAAGMQTAQQVMVNRVDKLSVAAPSGAIQGGNEIVVQLAGIHNTAKAAKIIGSTGQLQFFDFEKDLAPPSVNASGQPQVIASLYSLLKQLQDEAKKGTPEQYYLFGPKTVTKNVTTTVKGKQVTKKQTQHFKHARLAGPDPQLHDLLLPYKGKQPAGTEILKVPAHREIVGSTSGNAWYVFKYFPRTVAKSGAVINPNGPPEITGQDLNESGISADIASDSGQAEVLLSFKKHGAQEFQAITKAEYIRGRIAAGEAGQLGNNDPNTVVQYAGHNAIGLYGLLYYAAILLFNVTLTLPGFAGLILTIGVAADANVVVFERIKEEVRAGRSVRAAVAAGYGKGFHTILDANVVTVITAMVIFLIAVADVKGFALMLLIGTVISLLTAVAATRAMLGLLSGFRWFDNPHFMGAHGQQTAKWLQIDFMRRRYLWFGLSGAVILAGAIALGTRGLNLGIDFKGGTQIQFNTHKAYSQDSVTRFMTQQGERDAVVQGTGKSVSGDFKAWQIRTRSLTSQRQNNLTQSLKANLGAFHSGVKNVSGTFGHQIAIDAIYGIIVSLLLITIYIAVR